MENHNDLPDWIKEHIEEQENFNRHIYPKMTYAEKVSFWTAAINNHFRNQHERGYDPYTMFTPEWYDEMKASTPDFDMIMEEVLSYASAGNGR